MATAYSDLSSEPVTVVLPNGSSATWRQFAAIAQPSGVVFRFRLKPSIATPDVVAGETLQWADAFNQKSLVSGVRSIRTYQDVNAQDRIVDRMVVVVESDSGDSTDELDMPQSYLQQSLFNQQVEQAREQLNQTEAL